MGVLQGRIKPDELDHSSPYEFSCEYMEANQCGPSVNSN
jgi:hypothetical protein